MVELTKNDVAQVEWSLSKNS